MGPYQKSLKIILNDIFRFTLALPVYLLLNTIGSSAQAELYKWVDDQGNTHYSDKTPLTNKHTVITPDETASQQAINRNAKKILSFCLMISLREKSY